MEAGKTLSQDNQVTGSRVVNALSFDIEDYFQVSNFESFVRFEDWNDYESRVERNTDKILAILDDNDCRATFFVLGKMADRAAGKELVRRMLAEGHTVGNHSWNHPNFRKISKSKVRKEVERTQKLLESLGVTSRYIRAPYGATNKEVRALLHEMDMDLIGWNVDPEDWKHRSIEWVSRALQGVDRREDSNIVMHDIHASTAKHLPTFLDELEERYADRDLTFVNEF